MPELNGLTHFDCDPMTDFLSRVVFIPLLSPGDRACFIFRNNDWSNPPPVDPVWNLAFVIRRDVSGTSYSYFVERTGVIVSDIFTFDINYITSDLQYQLHILHQIVFRMNGNEFSFCIDGEDIYLSGNTIIDAEVPTEGEFGVAVYGSGSIDLSAFELWPASASRFYHSLLSTRGRFNKDPQCFTFPVF